MTNPFAIAAGLGFGLIAGTALAAPAALVEDAPAGLAGVEVMDYLDQGRTITLAAGQKLVLSYLHSCVNETITGGKVTVGLRESNVEGGTVQRATAQCNGGALLLSAGQAGKAGVSVMRDVSATLPGALPNPQITLYRTMPVIQVAKPGPVVFERLDAVGTPFTVEMFGRVIDLATAGGTKLTPGALYRVSSGDKSYVVRVDAGAKAEGGSALGRLIRF